MSAFLALIVRDIRLAYADGGAIGTALGFYLVVVALIPLGLGPDLNLLQRIGPGVLWVALLLSALLSMERIFQNDYEDGTLELLTTGPLPLEAIAAAKSLAHWIAAGIPLMLLSPLLGLLLNLEADAFAPLLLTMLAGTPALSFMGSIGAALTCGIRRGGLLLALLLLPLYIPIIIFSLASVNALTAGYEGWISPFSILCAITLASMVLSPVASAAALRNAIQ
jgi:heme exporter protein CcmB